jgi:predicted Rossmann fold flavoprotein
VSRISQPTPSTEDFSPWPVVVVGGGAAGLLAAIRAAERGRRVLLLEKNRRPGVKILMSGGTRCNITQATDRPGIIAAFGRPGRFLHSALRSLGPQELVALIEAEGVATKIEATGKIFPVSDRAADVLDALLRRLARSGATLATAEAVREVLPQEGHFRVRTTNRELLAESLIVTTGGQSYPMSGTCGDGYGWARQLGHTIVPLRPALTPVTTADPWIPPLQGITIPDVRVRAVEPASGPGAANPLDERRGSFLFAHFGLSGPAVLDISRVISGHPAPQSLQLECDFLPDLHESAFREALAAAGHREGKRSLSSWLADRLPRRLVEALLAHCGVPPEQRFAELSQTQRRRIIASVKQQPIRVQGTRGFKKAEVTAGGVDLHEVDSRTMQSRLHPGLYFAGEILDLDGPIGGYNFQAAFSTGWLAGDHA